MDRNERQQQKSDELVAGPREQKYGHPKDNYRRIAHIWSAVLGIEVTPTQAVLCELGVKFSRLIQSPDDEDTQVDVHGYIKVLQRLLDPDDQPGTTVSPTSGKVYVGGELWGFMKDGIFRMKPKTAPWEPGKGEFYSDPAGTTIHADGSKDMTFEEACGGRNPCGQ